MRGLERSNSERQKVDQWVPGGGGGRENEELVFNRRQISVWGEETVLERDGNDVCTTTECTFELHTEKWLK